MKCVIPCISNSSVGDLSSGFLLPVNGKKVLEYVKDLWCEVPEDLVVVVNETHREEVNALCMGSRVVVVNDLYTLSEALLAAEPFVGERFVVSSGDCIYRGLFEVSMFDMGIGVHLDKVPDTTYTVDTNVAGTAVTDVFESWHPKTRGSYSGMNVFFFDRRVFNYIRQVRNSNGHGGVSILSVVRRMIEDGLSITPVWFKGKYLQVSKLNHPEQVKDILVDS